MCGSPIFLFAKSGNLNQTDFSLQREDSRESTGSKQKRQEVRRNASRPFQASSCLSPSWVLRADLVAMIFIKSTSPTSPEGFGQMPEEPLPWKEVGSRDSCQSIKGHFPACPLPPYCWSQLSAPPSLVIVCKGSLSSCPMKSKLPRSS